MFAAAVVCVACISTAHAAQVQHLNTQTATATGAGATGTPAIASFNIPSGKNRVLFIWPTFERDHCSNADATGRPLHQRQHRRHRPGRQLSRAAHRHTAGHHQQQPAHGARRGPGGTINKQNALVIGGTPSGDTRFINISTSPMRLAGRYRFFSVSSFHIVLFENEINTLLGGAASGTVTITLPDTAVPPMLATRRC